MALLGCAEINDNAGSSDNDTASSGATNERETASEMDAKGTGDESQTESDAHPDGDISSETPPDTQSDHDTGVGTDSNVGSDSVADTASGFDTDPPMQLDTDINSEIGDTSDTVVDADTGEDTGTRGATDSNTIVDDTEAETNTDSGTESATDTDTGIAVGTETEAETDTDTYGATDSDTAVATDTEAETDTDTDSAIDSDTAVATDSATDSATVVDTDTDTESDLVTDTDTDSTETDSCADVPPTGTEVIDVTDSGSFGNATISLVSVRGQPFAEAWRCVRVGTTEDPADSQIYFDSTNAILAGDYLVATFWTRCFDSLTGTCRTGLVFEQTVSPWANSVEYYLVADDEWTRHQIPFIATIDFPSGDAHVTFRLEYDDQTIGIYLESVENFGQDEPFDCLPDSTTLWDEVHLISSPPTTTTANNGYFYRLEFNGRPEPTVEITGLPDWLDFDGRRVLSGVPQLSDVGLTTPITITVSNENGVDTQVFQIDVEA